MFLRDWACGRFHIQKQGNRIRSNSGDAVSTDYLSEAIDGQKGDYHKVCAHFPVVTGDVRVSYDGSS
jgi:hypothetical protein